MKTQTKRSIFYFEDDINGVVPIVEILKENHEVIVGANWELIKKKRKPPFDLVIIDLLIHHYSIDEKNNEKQIENVFFEGIDWKRTGIEFLRRIRQGEYEKFGFPEDIPAIIASAVGDYNVYEEAHKLGINDYFEKPFIIEDIERAVSAIFNR